MNDYTPVKILYPFSPERVEYIAKTRNTYLIPARIKEWFRVFV